VTRGAVRVDLVRHGRAAAGWGAHLDPGLDPVGLQQAEAAAEVLAPSHPRLVLTSPLRRARETALPLTTRWNTQAVVEARLGEIVSPTDDLTERAEWLRQVMNGSWSDAGADAGADVAQWRSGVLTALRDVEEDAVAFTHFIAINVIVGAALGRDEVVVFAPDNASITTVEVDVHGVRVVQLGHEATTVVR
jgi:broad specificity phosphatase PhoE